ncbi:hypothetical protein [Legionella oakridgensis]|nr:hypothetical protein [Legionella oakridgensis]
MEFFVSLISLGNFNCFVEKKCFRDLFCFVAVNLLKSTQHTEACLDAMLPEIINVCLVPDEAHSIGKDFIAAAIALSSQFNAITPSYYQLDSHRHDGIYSKPHCTIAHIKIPLNPDCLQSLKYYLQDIIGHSIEVQVTGLTSSVAGIFSKTAIIKGFHDPTLALAYWLQVAPTVDLINLQSLIVHKVRNKGTCITAQQEQYEPHFTLWAKQVEQNQQSRRVNNDLMHQVLYTKPPFLLPCTIALGNCGPNGQVRKFVTQKDEIDYLEM